MEQLLSDKILGIQRLTIDKNSNKLSKKQEGLVKFKAKEYKKIDKSYNSSLKHLNKIVLNYENKIKKIEEKKIEKNNENYNLVSEKTIKFLESKVQYYNEEIDLLNQNTALAKEDLENGVDKADKNFYLNLIENVNKKYARKNLLLNINTLKPYKDEWKDKSYQSSKEANIAKKESLQNYQDKVREMYEDSGKEYTPGFIRKENIGNAIKGYFNKIGNNWKTKVEEMKNYRFVDWLNMKIWGIPLYLMAIFVTVVGLEIGLNGDIGSNMIYAFTILIVIAAVFGVLFNKIPIFNKYMGGAVIGCMLIGALITKFDLFPKEITNGIKTWFKGTEKDNNNQGFLDFYVSVLLIGAILSIHRKMIAKSLSGFFGIILIGSLAATAFGFLASMVMGVSMEKMLLDYMLPILCAGNGGGVQPIKTIADTNGFDGENWINNALAVSTVASILSILVAAVVANMGNKWQSLSGNGQLMKQDIHTISRKPKISNRDIISSLLVVSIIFMFSTIISDKILTKQLLGIAIPNYAWMVVIAILVNVCNILKAEQKEALQKTNLFISKQTTWLLMLGVGICYIDLDKFIGALNLTTLFISFMFVIGATISIMFVAKLFKMNPIEASLSGGLCMTAQGGTGVVSVLGVSNRMELMAFGQITCRIGGSLILIVASVIFGYYGQHGMINY